MKILRGDGGVGKVEITLGDLEVEEFAATLQAFLDLQYRARSGDESSAEDSTGDTEAPMEEASRAAKKADAFMDLVRTAVEHADGGHAAGDDRYLVHLVRHQDGVGVAMLDGRPLHPTDAAMVACDTSVVVHTVTEGGEPLRLGRKTREWNTAQRRAISVRDGGHCRFVACQFAHYDIHHIQPWEQDGTTDIDNGACQCRRHHHMIHAGYRMQGDPNGELRYYRPDGTYIGSTYPAHTRQLADV